MITVRFLPVDRVVLLHLVFCFNTDHGGDDLISIRWFSLYLIKWYFFVVNAALFLRDTAGQERFRTLTTAYYRGAMGILLMYDVTSLDSFNHLSYWLRNIQEVRSRNMSNLVLSIKCQRI